ncbi:hypothetical protein C9374_002511 [Naegleria lovaniensis]|uniref:Uncharacterized protein n=1 Tax=Naegleria lovaniensis TaxID=51637 RepID=A0AA88GQ10_NAELO|nr:uncharacterized protein C9374_002511 [Naegleria lovaniensis]KAG2386767.1 hypothetical protein C9374_002511 [Naegleria lovaniensis]
MAMITSSSSVPHHHHASLSRIHIHPLVSQFYLQEDFPFETTPARSSSNTSNLLSIIPSFAVNVSSLVNSFIFIIAFVLFFAVVIGMFLVAKSSSPSYVMKRSIQRNQKILLFLTCTMVFIQICGLMIRVLYNGFSLGYNLQHREVVFDEYFVVTQVFGMIENFLIEVQTVTIFIIMCFIQNVFLKTAYRAGTMKKRVFIILVYLSNISTFLFSFITLSIVIAIAATNLLVKLSVLVTDQIPLYATALLIYLILVSMQSILFVYFGIRVMRTIRQRSLNLKQETNRNAFINAIQKPFIKVLILTMSMCLSTFIQILSAIASVLSSSFSGDTITISYFLNSFGILLFAVCVVMLYNPLFAQDKFNMDMYAEQERDRQLVEKGLGSQMSSPRIRSIAYEKSMSVSALSLNSDSNVENTPRSSQQNGEGGSGREFDDAKSEVSNI